MNILDPFDFQSAFTRHFNPEQFFPRSVCDEIFHRTRFLLDNHRWLIKGNYFFKGE